jgi:hypothetical protein
VFVDAFVPDSGETLAGLAGAVGPPPSMQVVNGGLVPSWVPPDSPPPRDVPHPVRTFLDTLVLKSPAWRKIPGTYILTVERGAATDQFDAPAAPAKARGYTVLRMEGDHVPERTAPAELVRLLVSLP